MNKQHIACLSMVAAFAFAATTVQALPVTNTYQVVSRFATGAIPVVTSTFTLSFDPSVSSGAAAVTSYSSSIGSPAFTPASVQFSNEALAGQASSVTLGGATGGPGVVAPGTDDLSILFFADPATGAVPAGRMLVPFSVLTSYSLASSRTTYSTTDATISLITSAVPEAASWAMMVAGFGMAGAALRRRPARSDARLALA